MRVLFLSGREINYTRNDVLLRALQRFSEVVYISSNVRPVSLFLNSAVVLVKAIPRLIYGNFDLIFVGFYGHILMLFPFRLLFRKKVIFDAFISTYDTLIGDRKKGSPGSFLAKLALLTDKIACGNSDKVLVDTPQQVDYFNKSLNISLSKLRSIPVGCNEDIFFPRKGLSGHTSFRVLFYSTYLPLHGVDIVVKAASLLMNETVHIRLIGSGTTFREVKRLASQLSLSNVEFVHDIPIEQLAAEIAEADVCLGGPFGTSEKAGRVIPGKIYQILAMAKPVIASNTPANISLLQHLENALLVTPGKPEDLADGIRRLRDDIQLREHLAKAGHKKFEECCSEEMITNILRDIISRIIEAK